jgi:diguanylate cyclase (GGDEF)-like protein/PAS domain S-box-containing protein
MARPAQVCRGRWPMGRLTVGILSPYLAGSYFGALIDAIAGSVWRAGGRVVSMQTARPGLELQEASAEKMPARAGWDHIGGVVVIGEAVPGGYLAELEAVGKPVVTIGHEEEGFSCPAVLVDNRGGTRRAVEHLIWHGHTRISFVGCMETLDVRERYSSYCEALSANGLKASGELFYEVSDNVEFGGQDAGKRMIDAGLPSTAVVAATDLNAFGVMKVLKEAGLSLPADQAVTGFDNCLGSAWMVPALSTVSQDLEKVGTKAAELLLSRLRGEDVPCGRHLLDAPFIVRESCGCTSAEARRASWGGSKPGCAATGTTGTGGADDPFACAEDDLLADEIGLKEPATRVADIFRRACEADLTDTDLGALRQACEEFYRLRPSQSTADLLLAFADRAAGLAKGAPGSSEQVTKRLRECRAAVQLGLTRAALSERTGAYYAVRQAVREEYLIAKDILSADEGGGWGSLNWLRQTEALAAVFGVWEGTGAATAQIGATAAPARTDLGAAVPWAAWRATSPTEERGRQLRLISRFGAAEGGFGMPGSLVEEQAFPPAALLGLVEEGWVASVIPISSERANWGLLGVVAPANPACIGQDMYYVWAALFAEVLDRQALTSSLLVSEERYSLAARATYDGLWDWDLANDRVYYSERWKEMLGYGSNVIGDGPEEWLERVHPEDSERLSAELLKLRKGESDKAEMEHRVRAADGRYVWVLCRALAVPGAGAPAVRVVGSLTDVTERHALEEQLRRAALYDQLTGLPNRAVFVERLSQALSAAKRPSCGICAVLWLDLDNFKELNDKKGHFAGDKLLVQFARRIRAKLRDLDTPARFGGDEFAVLLVDVPQELALGICQRLIEELCKPYKVDGQEFALTASAGVVLGIDGYTRPEDVLRDADAAMYEAKSAGGGRVAAFGPSVARRALETS